jgi:hypothetical protein
VALGYGLATCVWSTSSQALWQHGPTELFLALGTFFLLRQNRSRSAPWVGLCYTLAFACRPTAALAVAAAGIYYAICDRRALLAFVAGCVPVAALITAYNLHTFGKWVVLGQLADLPEKGAAASLGAGQVAARAADARHGFGASFIRGLGGILISPSRGLLIFSPALAFLFWGMVRVWRDRAFSALRPVAVAAATMCLLVARWYGWWGGWCYGYRLLVDAVTLLAFLAIPVAETIRRRRALFLTCAACLLWGFVVQVAGAFAYDVVSWNDRAFTEVKVPGAEPLLFTDVEAARREAWARGGSIGEARVDVNSRRGRPRLWSLRDNQILFYLGHFLEARATKQIAIDQFLRERG